MNLTCLVPTENPEVAAPLPRADLKTILWHFLHFRHRVVTRRLENELAKLLGPAAHPRRLRPGLRRARRDHRDHPGESDGKADAAEKIMARFDQLDAEQTEAILELKLYRLARLEIHLVEEEREAKRARADEVEALLADDDEDTEPRAGGASCGTRSRRSSTATGRSTPAARGGRGSRTWATRRPSRRRTSSSPKTAT